MPKRALADDGTVMLVEPFANDRDEDNLNTVGRSLLLGFDHALLRALRCRRTARPPSALRPARRAWLRVLRQSRLQ